MSRTLFVALIVLVFSASAFAQFPDRRTVLGGGGGSYIVFGDLQVDESQSGNPKPLVYEIVLNNAGGLTAGRQYVSAGGRYQFINLAAGQYEIVVLLDHEEVARTRVEILPGPAAERIRQDLTLAWKPIGSSSKPSSISAADYY